MSLVKSLLNRAKKKLDILPKDSDKSDKNKPKSSVPTNPGRIKPGTQPTI